MEQHEIFEMQVLQFLKRNQLLGPLVFGGGTMLRLCHDMPRYSTDMDFYFKQRQDKQAVDAYFATFKDGLATGFEITDAQNKFHTLLFEIRDAEFPRRLKLEINKDRPFPVYHATIAFSPHATDQVLLDTVPLPVMLTGKLQALLDRREIRDAFDVEYLLRRGIPLPEDIPDRKKILTVLEGFTQRDFNVKLGSLLPQDMRDYYKVNRFGYLEDKLQADRST